MKETKLNKIITKNLSARVSDTVISSLRRDEAHAVVTARLGHPAHLGRTSMDVNRFLKFSLSSIISTCSLFSAFVVLIFLAIHKGIITV